MQFDIVLCDFRKPHSLPVHAAKFLVIEWKVANFNAKMNDCVFGENCVPMVTTRSKWRILLLINTFRESFPCHCVTGDLRLLTLWQRKVIFRSKFALKFGRRCVAHDFELLTITKLGSWVALRKQKSPFLYLEPPKKDLGSYFGRCELFPWLDGTYLISIWESILHFRSIAYLYLNTGSVLL